jgi:hypothetical protein
MKKFLELHDRLGKKVWNSSTLYERVSRYVRENVWNSSIGLAIKSEIPGTVCQKVWNSRNGLTKMSGIPETV